jgi:hypothetical protein
MADKKKPAAKPEAKPTKPGKIGLPAKKGADNKPVPPKKKK